MTPEGLGTTNVWLAILAISSLVQLLMVVGLLVGTFLFYRRIEATVNRIKQEQIAPVTARAHKVIDEVEHAMARFRSIGEGVGNAATAVSTRLWPVIGLARGVRAGLAALTERRPATARVPVGRTSDKRFR